MSKLPQSQPIDDVIQNPKFASSALDFLLIELVPLAQRVTEQLQAREQALIDEYKRSKIFNSSRAAGNRGNLQTTGDFGTSTVTDGTSVNGPTQGAAGENITSLGFPGVGDETREAMFWRLDGLGYRVGQGLVER